MSFLNSILSFFTQVWNKVLSIWCSKNGFNNIFNRHQDSTTKKLTEYSKNLPYPKGLLPIVGPLFSLIAAGGAPYLHLYIDKRHRELGPIFSENLGGGRTPIVFVSSAKLMRAVFNFEGKYPKHPIPEAWKIYNEKNKCSRGLLFMDGEEWYDHRRLLNRSLLNGNLSWMQSYIQRSTQKVIHRWLKLVNGSNTSVSIPNLESQMYRWSIDVICSIMFGNIHENCPLIESALDEFSQIVFRIFESTSPLMNFPPRLAQILNLKIWQNFEQNITDVLSTGNKIIELYAEKFEQSKCRNEKTLYQMLLDSNMSTLMIRRIFVDLVIAAADTSAFTSEWCLLLLSKDMKLQNELYQEIIAENAVDSPLVRGMIKETLRLYPVAPFIGRYLDRNAILGNYFIQKNTMVVLSLYTAGRNENHFPHPLKVDPSRWLPIPNSDRLKGVNESHGTLPFGIGNRSCIGRRVAVYQLTSLITEIVKHFELSNSNADAIECILRLVAVPSEKPDIKIKQRI